MRPFFIHTALTTQCTGCDDGYPRQHTCGGYLHGEWVDSGEQTLGFILHEFCDLCSHDKEYTRDEYQRRSNP